MRTKLRTLAYGGLAVGALLGVALTLALPGWASRNSGGTYSLPPGNPVVPGTTISSSWANSTLSDIATEITNSLDRQGRGAMLAPLHASTGSAAAPSLSFSADPDTGLYRAAVDSAGLSAGGVQVQAWTPAGTSVTGNISASGALSATGNATVGGNATVTGTLGVTGATTLTSFSASTTGAVTGNFTVDTNTLHVDAATNRVGVGNASPLFPLDVSSGPTITSVRFNNGGPPLYAVGTGLGYNLHNNGANWVYGISSNGALMSWDSSGNGQLVLYTSPNGTAGATAPLTERMRLGPSGLQIGAAGTYISASIGTTIAIDFPSTGNGACTTSVQAFGGAAVGGVCTVSVDTAATSAQWPRCAVTGASQITISYCNATGVSVDPVNQNFRVRVWQP